MLDDVRDLRESTFQNPAELIQRLEELHYLMTSARTIGVFAVKKLAEISGQDIPQSLDVVELGIHED